jgi:hypothetical protein
MLSDMREVSDKFVQNSICPKSRILKDPEGGESRLAHHRLQIRIFSVAFSTFFVY